MVTKTVFSAVDSIQTERTWSAPARIAIFVRSELCWDSHDPHFFWVSFPPRWFALEPVVWEVYGDCKNEGVLKGHKKAILSVGWSHDGAHIYSVGADALTFDWDSHTGEVSRLFKGHIGYVECADFDPATLWGSSWYL